jgi:signal transduction histidine kinase
MSKLYKLSIRKKLIVIIMSTVVAVVLFIAGMVVINEATQEKRSLYERRTEQLVIVVDIIGSRSTAALIFNDATTAVENLNSLHALRSDEALVLAGIFKPDNQLFAEYRPNARQHRQRSLALSRGCETINHSLEESSLLWVCAPIRLDREYIGEVRIVFDMTNDLKLFKVSLKKYLSGVLLVVLVALLMALGLSNWLQRIISDPILHLREAMRKVSSSRDYSIRLIPVGDNELSSLVMGFNAMLEQIQLRDTELARTSDQLQDQVKVKTRELQKANDQRMLWLENLAHILRHELNSATLGVRSSLDLIERRTKNEDLRTYTDRARNSLSYMVRLLDSVGTASTLESSFDNDQRQPLDLSVLIARQLEQYAVIYPGVQIVKCCQSGLIVMASEARLLQLLDKLVANAVDFHVTGSPVKINAECQNTDAVLSVSNYGVALPEDKQRIFELFMSIRDAKHKQSENFGLGLYIVKLIVESHGGKVTAEDLPNLSGAQINVILPLAKEIEISHD